MDRRALNRSLAYVDSWLRWRCPRADIPGCALAVSHQGRVLLSAAYGHADVAASRSLGPDDVFCIGSHSKSFTATAILQLVEQGRVRLDDPVVNYLSWLADHRDRRFQQVTLRQLLCHGAGVLRDGLDSEFWQLGRPFPDAVQLRSEVLDAELVTDPNVALKYSNVGYGLLGLVIEEVSGRSFHDFVHDHIIKPLGLTATAVGLEPGLAGRAVTGYGRREPNGERLAIPPVDTAALAPAGGLVSTASDLCRFYSALFVGSHKLLDDSTKREMQRVHWHVHHLWPGQNEDYGLGLELFALGERRAIGHSGGVPGQSTVSVADPPEGLVVVVLTNCIDGPPFAIASGIYGVIDHFQRGVDQTPRRGLRRLEGRYVNLWYVCDVVVAGATVSVVSPNTWAPFTAPERLEPITATTLRIAETSSVSASGELVHVQLQDGQVDTLRWAGMTLWPEERWPKMEQALLGAASPSLLRGQRRGNNPRPRATASE